MTKTGSGSVIALIILFLLTTCLEPYTPDIQDYQSLLVVDGMISDENSSYKVKLSGRIVLNKSYFDFVLFQFDILFNLYDYGT